MKVSKIVWWQALGLAATVGFLLGASAQAANVPSLVTQPVNNAQRVILKGNVQPLARPQYDHGLAPDSLPMDRMLLVLKRSKQQQTALDNLLVGQQEKSSSEYHHWVTPQEFGKEFGPSASDIQAVTDWLTSEGFQVNRVSNGRTVIEFSGTAGLVRQVLYTEIHKYVIKGKSYWANASDPQIPAALAPVVRGIASLNNFPRRPMDRPVGVFSRSKTTGKIKALYTFNCPSGYNCTGRTFYALGPTDFATIYNVLPLWNSSPAIDGAGETIAIVSDSNIQTQDVANFRSMFGLPANPVNVILNGPDPGLTSSETEADADTEWAGAVAPNATIDLVVSEDTEVTAGVDLSALYIVDNNLAPVLSESYGACELALGNAGNAFESAMWEQAAAEGITVVVAGGDSGSAGCDNPSLEDAAQYGLAVNGSASTPYNVAVGGTDFDNPSSYFSTTNDPTTQASAKSYVPEIIWNDSCAQSGLATDCGTSLNAQDLTAGAGGESNCALEDSSGNCSAGYSKPVWQTGTGVPADGLRDIPDISLFASNGYDNAFYVVCTSDETAFLGGGSASCSGDISTFDFMGIGGTSLSTPAFAAIIALVNQKTGQRQGNANFVLYPLAAAAAKNSDDCTSNAAAVSNTSCVFYDITQGHNSSGTAITPGNNSVACVAGSPDCYAPTGYSNGILVQPGTSSTPAWTTSAGYDLATGLGTVNVANLVDNWASFSFHSSSTTLSLSPTTLTHGQSVTASIGVTSSAGTPTGDVELMGNPKTALDPTGANNIGIAGFTLGSGGTATGTTNMLPGGTYNVFAHYAGDGTSGSSDSTPPISVTVNPEDSQTTVSLVTFSLITGQVSSSNATTTPYGSPYILRTDVLNSSGNQCAPNGTPEFTCPTGSVSLTANGQPLDQGSYALNSMGYAEDQPIQFAGGTYKLVGTYSGDNSYNPSKSTTNTITITKATTATSAAAPTQAQSGSISFTVTVSTQSNGAGPTGTVQIYNGSSTVGNPAKCQGIAATSTTFASCQATATITLTSKTTFTAEYSGDGNYASSTSAPFTISVATADFSMSVIPTGESVKSGDNADYTVTVTPEGGFDQTVALACSGAPSLATCSVAPASVTLDGTHEQEATITVTTTASSLVPPAPPGAPPAGRWPLGLWLGLIGMLGLAALAWFRTRGGTALPSTLRGPGRLKGSSAFRWGLTIFVTMLLGAALCSSCGGGGSSSGSNPGTPAGTYTLTVTGTSGSLSHSATTTLTVQ